VETLKEEKILEPEKAEDVQKQLERLQEKSSAVDPNKTWEALDHIKNRIPTSPGRQRKRL
jgi:hypothetical protein